MINPNTDSLFHSHTNREEAKKGEIACVIYDEKGVALCPGKRCGSPDGNCGRKETVCQCISTNRGDENLLINGMTIEEFNALWQSPEGNKMLKKLGYYEEDK